MIDEAEVIYTALSNNDITLHTVSSSETLAQIKRHVEERKMDLTARSKTSALWLNYQNMLQVARSLVMADRTGSWLMHLRAVCDCIPIFAAAGHYNYLKSAHLYLQHGSAPHRASRRIHEVPSGLSCHPSQQQVLGGPQFRSRYRANVDEVAEDIRRSDAWKWNV